MSEILIQNVSKTYSTKDGNVQALKNVNLSIEQGDIYGIIGMSGAGKSTLVRCINYLEEPTEGKIFIKGKELGSFSKKELRKQREDIGMIFQHFNLLMQKSVLENICFPLYIHGKKKTEARKRAKELLEIVGLSDKAKAYPAQLSGGQKQRVAIARALASNPKILLCDEATSALDPQTTASILDLLKEINQKFGITIVNTGKVAAKISKGKNVRIVFSENSSFEPVIANMILQFNEPVNILKANTKNVGGVAKGEMILGFQEDSNNVEKMKEYLIERGLEIEEVDNYVE